MSQPTNFFSATVTFSNGSYNINLEPSGDYYLTPGGTIEIIPPNTAQATGCDVKFGINVTRSFNPPPNPPPTAGPGPYSTMPQPTAPTTNSFIGPATGTIELQAGSNSNNNYSSARSIPVRTTMPTA